MPSHGAFGVKITVNFVFFLHIGKGVFAEKNFNKGEFLFEYDGQLKPADETVEDDQTFIFHFKCDGKNLW